MHIIRSYFAQGRAESRTKTSLARRLQRLGTCLALLLFSALTLQAQLDEDKREMVQFGYNQPVEGQSPLSVYAFYYLNIPHFIKTNLYLRTAIAPTYLDGELGFKSLLGPHTDLGVGLAGGGFGDSYFEIRDGRFIKSESFTGHGGGVSSSIYHLFNPDSRVPLNGILRVEGHYSVYERDSNTSHQFQLPEDHASFHLRSGLRWGGQEPIILPAVAMELSAWYDGAFRTDSGAYGFNRDRELREQSHLFWGRGLLTYTLPNLKHNFSMNLTAGTSVDADRFSAYRIGGVLPLASEFPLSVPGYYFQELSARNFALLGGSYSIPLGKGFAINGQAAAAVVDYLPDLRQPHPWARGVGAGLIYRSPKQSWQAMLSYGYGIDAIRSHGYGAHNIGILVQFDLERARVNMFEEGQNPIRARGLERIFNSLNLF